MKHLICSTRTHALVCISTFVFAFQFATFARTEDPDPVAQIPEKGQFPDVLLSLNTSNGIFSPYAFLVDKARRTLTVWKNASQGLQLMGAWPTDIGRRGGDKLVQGDHRTPEGVYFFQTQMDGRSLDYNNYGVRIFTLDYPNYFDRLERKTGNGIWFHAIPDTKSLLRGSRGCVVVRNTVIEELSQYIELKSTPMVIVDEVNYLTPQHWMETKTSLTTWLEGWRKAWGGKDLETYMAYYGDRFSGNGMNRSQWRRFKENLNKNYDYINVDLKDVQVFNQGPKIVFRFLQNYQSDKKQDVGLKTLYALKGEKGYEIIGETWSAARPHLQSANQSASTTY